MVGILPLSLSAADLIGMMRPCRRSDSSDKSNISDLQNVLLDATPKSVALVRPFHPMEGRIAIATNAGWNAMDASCVAWRAARARTAKACGPDALVAGVKLAE
jgi:hypothetical protein